MPVIPAAAAPALVPTFISFDDDGDDDDFGEFEFAPASSSSSQQQPPAAREAADDEWGDFVVSPLQNRPPKSSSYSAFFDPFSALHAADPDPSPIRPEPAIPTEKKGWEKPTGALPLSLFGGDDDDEGSSNSLDPPPLSLPPFKDRLLSSSFSSKLPASNGVAVGSSGGLKDLIASLYGQVENKIGPSAAAGSSAPAGIDGSSSNNNAANGVRFDSVAATDDDEFDDSCWEFQDAVSDTCGGDPSTSQLKLVERALPKEEKHADVPVVETNATANGGGIQVVGNRWENMQGPNHPSRACNDEWEWEDAFDSYDGSINGLDRGPAFLTHNCISNPHHEIKHINTENGTTKGEATLDESFGEFIDASSDFEMEDYCHGQEKDPKIADQLSTKADSEISNDKFQGIDLVLGNHLGNLSPSTFSNDNQDFCEPFVAVDGNPYVHTSTKTSEDFNFGPVIDFNDVSNLYNQPDHTFAVNSIQNPTGIGWGSHESVLTSQIVKGDNNCDGNISKLNVFSESKVKNHSSAPENVDTDCNISNEQTMNIFVNFYSRLKERSHSLVLHHIDNLKKAHEFAAISGDELRAMNFDKEIQAAYSKLQDVAASGNDFMEGRSPEDVSINELLGIIQEPCFQALETEYHLSEKIPLAKKDLSSAVWLFEHAILLLHILTLASCEEQHTYIIAWSKMVSACGQELQHGAVIWAQSLHANVHKQLLSESRGHQYFLALGEIYRVAEILRVSTMLYKPWILSNPVDSRDMLNCLEKCAEAWMDSGLKKALESLSETVVLEEKRVLGELLESIKFISDINAHTLQTHVSSSGEPVCRLSLLPVGMLQDMKGVVWHGKHYFCKVANLWANVISCDPPELPHVHIG